MVVLIGFITGSFIATFHMPFWWAAPSLGVVSLGDSLGWFNAVALQLAAFAVIAAGSWFVERRKRRSQHAVVSAADLHWSWIHGPWPLLVGAIGLALLNAATLLLAGHAWSITWAFSLWGGKLAQAVGYDLSQIAFWRGPFQQQALSQSVLADSVSVMDFGLLLGAFLGSGLANRFTPAFRLPIRGSCFLLGAGLMLGYGARMSFGCNIGAYFSGIASTSLHGWVWLLGALLGTPLGVKLRDWLLRST
jgi:hypothetical protein